MASIKLTEKGITALPAPTDAVQAYYWDEDSSGLGVVVGRSGVKTFVVRGRVAGSGDRAKVTIGRVGDVREDGHTWTLALARLRAKEILGAMAGGTNPNARPTPRGAPGAGPTLRDAMEAHLGHQRKKGRSPRTIQTFEAEITKYLAAWLDRPIAELTGAVLVELHESIKRTARDKGNRNTSNEKGAPLANRVITSVSACWNSLNRQLEGKLGTWNPAKSVVKDALKPKRERLADVADWYRRVQTMTNPIGRDGLVLALYTGLRHEDVRSIRWEHVDWKAHTLRLPDPKGGEAAAFEIPLSKSAYSILERRKRENAASPVFSPLGGDAGFAFPTVVSDGKVAAITDLREQRHHGEEGHSRFPAEDVHTLRRTWESIAHEEGVSELDQHVLSNHSYGSHNVNATYIAQHIDHLARCAAKIDAGVTRRIGGKGARQLRSSSKASRKRLRIPVSTRSTP